MSRAACADLEAAEADRLFFSRAGLTLARVICRACPVAEACLKTALDAEDQDPAAYRFGIYAATTGTERAQAVGASLYGANR